MLVPRYIAHWAAAFAITIGVEVPLAYRLLRTVEPRPVRRFAAGLFANLITHPMAWFVVLALLRHPAAMMVTVESWAVGAEAAFYSFLFPSRSWRFGLAVSIVVNAASFAVGVVSSRLTGWP